MYMYVIQINCFYYYSGTHVYQETIISVYESPDALPFLNYSVPLVGVVEPVTLNIHRAQRNPPPPSTSNR